tara:strand:+ start:2855 stop:3046 length:192 start_codon:yes stop_codon:yes gene_type:complete
MAYHIKKSSVLSTSKTVYYKGNSSWSDVYADRKTYSAETDANAEIVNTDGKNGGFKGSTVVSE